MSVLQNTIVETMRNDPKARCAFEERLLSLSAIMAVFMTMVNERLNSKTITTFASENARWRTSLN